MSEWQPIESAPKDDEVSILMWCPQAGYAIAVVGEWDANSSKWVSSGDGDPISPSHWMPLPPPPHPKGEQE
jgi:hypothetical protein